MVVVKEVGVEGVVVVAGLVKGEVVVVAGVEMLKLSRGRVVIEVVKGVEVVAGSGHASGTAEKALNTCRR